MKAKTSFVLFILTFLGAFTAAAATLNPTEIKRVLILGDRTCAGSTDTTVIAAEAPARAYTYATGLYATPDKLPDTDISKITPYKATADDRFGAQTMVDGLHAALTTASDPGVKAIVYTIIADDRPISQWDFGKLPADADAVVWMHGSLEYGTPESEYAAGLERLAARYSDSKIVFVQPGNGGAVFAARTAAAQ